MRTLSFITTHYNEPDLLVDLCIKIRDFSAASAISCEVIVISLTPMPFGCVSQCSELISDFGSFRAYHLDACQDQILLILSGLRLSSGDAAFVVDPDSYKALDYLPEFLTKNACGMEIVFGKRVGRDGVSLCRRAMSAFFNLYIRTLFSLSIKDFNTGILLISKKAIDEYVRRHRNFNRIDFYKKYEGRTCEIEIKISEPKGRQSTYSVWRLFAVGVRRNIEAIQYILLLIRGG